MITSYAELLRLRQLHRDKRIVLVGGCYDLIHVGHLKYLERCRELGDLLVVVASSDHRVRQRKGPKRPVIGESDRVQMLSGLSCVDYALVAPVPNAHEEIPTVMVIEQLAPDIFATSDSRFTDYAAALAERGTRVVHVPDMRVTSTTRIIASIQNE